MRIVLVDAAERAWGAVLVDDGGDRPEVHWLGPGTRLEAALPDLLAAACASTVDALVTVTGPGSLTGIRVATAALVGCGLARGLPVHGVGSLEVAALLEPRPGPARAVRSAGRGGWHAVDVEIGPTGSVELVGPVIRVGPGGGGESSPALPTAPLDATGAVSGAADRWAQALALAARLGVGRPPLDLGLVDPATGVTAGPRL